MLFWPTGKRLTKSVHALSVRRRKPSARMQRLQIESLEARCLLTVAPLLNAVPLPTVNIIDVAPLISAVTSAPPASLSPITGYPSDPTASTSTTTSPTTTASAPIPQALSASQLAAETSAGKSIDVFGLDLYKALQAADGGSGNMFVSPFSISTALAMVFAGARGETAAQMANTLHLSGSLADLNSAGQGDFALSVADALWGQQGVHFLSEFLNTLQTDYDGGLNQVDFINAPEATRKTINAWVAEHTNGKIENLFPEGSIDTYTRLVLANAIYFKGNWATQFNVASTNDSTFTLASGANEWVKTMHAIDSYRYMERDGFQVLEIPYAGGRLVMDVLLPSFGSGTGGLSISQLPNDLNDWFGGLRLQDVDVSLPKFTLTTQFDLGDELEALGITDAFARNADLSGMSESTRLKISQVLHKAFIGVDETGTEAAAATGIAMFACENAFPSRYMGPIVFDADHPFLFMIRDAQSGSVLFIGQEADPLKTGGDPLAPGIDASRPTPQPIQSPVPMPIGPLLPMPPSTYSPIAPTPPIFAPDLGQHEFVGPTWPISPTGVISPPDAPTTGEPIDRLPMDPIRAIAVPVMRVPFQEFVGPAWIESPPVFVISPPDFLWSRIPFVTSPLAPSQPIIGPVEWMPIYIFVGPIWIESRPIPVISRPCGPWLEEWFTVLPVDLDRAIREPNWKTWLET